MKDKVKLTPGQRLYAKIYALHAMLGSSNKGEAESAKRLLDRLLKKYGKTWADLVSLFRAMTEDASEWLGDAAPSVRAPKGDLDISALTLVHGLLRQYVGMSEDELVATALWVLHTYVYENFMHTPRLALTSPVRGCGKTVVLDVVKMMSRRAHKCDGITAAVFYHRVENDRATMLIDEADNLPLAVDGPMRAAFNAGHRRGGTVERMNQGRPRAFRVFAPMAIAAIGRLPLPTAHRSIIIRMRRYACEEPLRRFDINDTQDLLIAASMCAAWAQDVLLNPNPLLPKGLRNRPADNWRPLIAIADSFGPEWGLVARDAALAFAKGHRDEDIGVVLLTNIRDLFDTKGVDRFTSAALACALAEREPWSAWCGIRDDQSPRTFSQGELAKLLAPFDIHPKTVWPARRHDTGASSSRGYHRSQFEAAWASYCDAGDTPAQTPLARLAVA